jgi:hypothetical protein
LGHHEVAALTKKIISGWHRERASSAAKLRTGKGAVTANVRKVEGADAVRKRQSTANRDLTVLKAALNRAAEHREGLPVDAWAGVKPFQKVDVAKRHYLNPANTRGRPFSEGNSGKPPGARHKVTRAVEALLEGEADALTRRAIDKALEGDTTALRLCLDRLAPPRKDAPISVALPRVKSASDAVEASAAVLEAVAAGEITPDEASRVMVLLTAHKAILEAGDLEGRIAALEEKTK